MSKPTQGDNCKATASFLHNEKQTDISPDLNESMPSTSTKLRFERNSKDPERPGKVKLKPYVGNLDDGGHDLLNGSHSNKEQGSVVPEDDTSSEIDVDHEARAPL